MRLAVTKKRPIPFEGFGQGYWDRTFRRKSDRKITLEQKKWFQESSGYRAKLQGTQVTVSENHVEWKGNYHPVSGDIGGDFTMKKQYALPYYGGEHVINSPWYTYSASEEYMVTYRGPLYIDAPGIVGFQMPPFANSSDTVLNAWGAKAVARCAPAKPTASLAQSMLEIYREGVPKMLGASTWQKRTTDAQKVFRSSGDEWLNYQFGWLPLVSDVKDVVQTIMNMDTLVKQYVRDSGQVVRRRYSFPPEQSVTETIVDANAFMDGPNGVGGIFDTSPGAVKAVFTRRRETSVRRWFSGAFTYHLPAEFYSKVGGGYRLRSVRRLLGLDLNPDLIWELAPWSWAVDWVTNVGDAISNLNQWSQDGLVMRYGYIMEHSIVRDTYTFDGPNRVIIPFGGRPAPLVLVSEAKLRRRANPFGFGLTWSGLTPRQLSILAALGLTR